jgi:predicted nucleic acid-binding protein
MKPPLRCVVDASVAVKLFVAEPDSAQADALFAHLAADPEARFYAPSLLYAECANILWKYVRRFGYARKDAERALSMLMDLSIDSVGISDIILDAHRTALSCGVSVYDACYAATAARMDVPLITADARLAEKLIGVKTPVFVLGRFSVPAVPSGLK